MKRVTGAVLRRTVAAVAATAVIGPVLAVAGPAQAAGSVTSAVSLEAPRTASYGAHMQLKGTVWRYGTQTKIAGVTIVLQRSPRGKNTWANVKSTRSGSTGRYAFTVTQTLAYDYRAFYAGSAVYKSARSAVRYPIVVQKVLFSFIGTASSERGGLSAVAEVYPSLPKGAPVYLQRYNPKTNSFGSIGVTRSNGGNHLIQAKVGGSVGYYRIYAPTRAPYAAGASSARRFAHYVWRGVFKKPILAKGGTGDPMFSTVPNNQDPDRMVAVTLADPNGTAWADVNTYGCVRARAIYFNFANRIARAEILKGSTALSRVNVARASGDPDDPEPGEAQTEIKIGGLAKVRLQLTDTGSTDGLDLVLANQVLCSN